MKARIVLAIVLATLMSKLNGQVMGNAAHGKSTTNIQYQVQLPTNIINVPVPYGDEFVLSIKGLINVTADNYVAIFSLNQAGKTAEEVNRLIDDRIKPISEYCKKSDSFDLMVDMISFVPIYEYDLIKKVFNKKTYNEVPVGFEVKKNIHIKYKNPNDLNKLIEICSQSEIYDLVRVDYFANNLAKEKERLMTEAIVILNKNLAARAKILGKDPKNYTMQMSDGYTVVYPVEMYTQYQTVATSKLRIEENSTINKAVPSTTYYYKPYFDKTFDFTINPTIFQPVIQVVYEIKVKYTPKPEKEPEPKPEVKVEPIVHKEVKIEKEIIIITQSGEMKTIKP